MSETRVIYGVYLERVGAGIGANPCPFCGDTRAMLETLAPPDSDIIHVECMQCGARGPVQPDASAVRQAK
jgi:hypothetical protein